MEKSSFAGVETFLFDCDEDLYGEEAWVELLSFRASECKFDSVEELKAQIQRDANAGKQYFQKSRFTFLRAYGILSKKVSPYSDIGHLVHFLICGD